MPVHRVSEAEQIIDAFRILGETFGRLVVKQLQAPPPEVQPSLTTAKQPSPALMTPAEAAAAIGVSAGTLSRLAAWGQIKTTKVGNRPRYSRAEVDRYCSQGDRKQKRK